MKSIVVYYSVSGQTEKVAKLIAKKEKSDILKIETVEEIKPDIFSRYYKGMKSMTIMKVIDKVAKRGAGDVFVNSYKNTLSFKR